MVSCRRKLCLWLSLFFCIFYTIKADAQSISLLNSTDTVGYAKFIVTEPTVCILDTDILDTDDIVAIERFATTTPNALGVVSCVNGGSLVITGILNSIGSPLSVSDTICNYGNVPEFADIYSPYGSMCDTNAVAFYKNVLRQHKTDIITIGFLSNLSALLSDSEGLELCRNNLGTVVITGGSMRGLGDTNFGMTDTILHEAQFVFKTLEELNVPTVFVTNDLAGYINTVPYDGLSSVAFASMGREVTPSWDIFSVYVYNHLRSNTLRFVPTHIIMRDDGCNEFIDNSTQLQTYRVEKVVTDDLLNI